MSVPRLKKKEKKKSHTAPNYSWSGIMLRDSRLWIYPWTWRAEGAAIKDDSGAGVLTLRLVWIREYGAFPRFEFVYHAFEAAFKIGTILITQSALPRPRRREYLIIPHLTTNVVRGIYIHLMFSTDTLACSLKQQTPKFSMGLSPCKMAWVRLVLKLGEACGLIGFWCPLTA